MGLDVYLNRREDIMRVEGDFKLYGYDSKLIDVNKEKIGVITFEEVYWRKESELNIMILDVLDKSDESEMLILDVEDLIKIKDACGDEMKDMDDGCYDIGKDVLEYTYNILTSIIKRDNGHEYEYLISR